MSDEEVKYDVFLSYNNRDHAEVELVARRLKDLGLTVFLDRWYLVAGTPWPQHLETILNDCRAAAIFLGPHGMGRWQQREQYLALDRQTKNSAFPVIPVLLPGADPALGFLSLNTWVDLRQGLDSSGPLTLLAGAIQGKPPGPDFQRRIATALSTICPYRGLRFFREEDAPFFFGRDAFIQRLTGAVNMHTLVAVVGASGSGKSSVVRAGLVPRLRQRRGNQVWDIATIVPGDLPLQSLAAVMVRLLEPDMTEVDRLKEIGKLAESFGAGQLRLRDVVSRAIEKQPGTDRLMLVVDQWEELYTLTRDQASRQTFLDEILDATTSSPLSVVLTLRGDFFDQVLSHRPFSDRIQDATVNVSRMTREELTEVIESPAQKVALRFESGLVSRILDQVQGQPGSLPLLEFVLMELWKERQEELLTHVAYEKLGELHGAIAAHAEAVFAGLTQTEQEIARRVFLRLVRPGGEAGSAAPDAEAEPTRRRTSFEELGEESLPVVRKLADAHLVVTGRNEATGEEIIDLVHEALIRAWSNLRQWIEDDRMFLAWQERLRTLMSISAASRRENSTLLRGNLLSEATAWLHKREPDLSTSEKQYIEASTKARNSQVLRQVIAASVAVITLLAFVYLSISNWNKGGRTATDFNLISNSSPVNNQNAVNNDGPTDLDFTPYEPDNLPPIADVKLPSGAVVIPVVVHVVYRTESENISDAQIKSQIDVLNKDFRARNEDIAKVPAAFKDAVGDAQIEFVLATTDPRGKPTNGITRTKTILEFFHPTGDNVRSRRRGGADAWPAEKYLNIWVCNIAAGLLGYSALPGVASEVDGVVINYQAFGTIGTATNPFNLGRQATHDIGHYLNLRHLWGDQPNCKGTDVVDDTPPQEKPNFKKPDFPHVTCNNGPNGDMFMNFMDNTDDDSRYIFTKGQVLRMHQTLQGPRRGLGVNKP